MAVYDYNSLREHIGHKIACVCYAAPNQPPANVAIECESCDAVLLDYDRPAPGDECPICRTGTLAGGEGGEVVCAGECGAILLAGKAKSPTRRQPLRKRSRRCSP